MCIWWFEIHFLYFLQLTQAAFFIFAIPCYFDVYTACMYSLDTHVYFKCLFYVYMLDRYINISYIVSVEVMYMRTLTIIMSFCASL